MLDLDALSYNNRLTHRSPIKKVVLALTAVGLSLATKTWWIHGVIFLVMGTGVVIAARISLKTYLRLYLIPMTFLLLSIGTLLISVSSTGEGLDWSRQIGKIFFGVSVESIVMVKTLLSRSIAALSGMYFLSITTPLNQLVRVFKKMHIPVLLIELVVLTYRFIHIFFLSVQDSYHALQLRNGFVDMKSARKSLAMLVVMTYRKMMESYGDWQMVLETKNFNGNFYV